MNSEFPADISPIGRIVFFAAVIVGLSYTFVTNSDYDQQVLLIWKGAGVWLLSVYAVIQARTLSGWMITAVMGLCAAGDVLLEFDLIRGGLAFVAAYLVASVLYFRQRRTQLSQSQRLLAYVVVPVVAFLGWSFPSDSSLSINFMIYGAVVSVMAAMAWTSRFPRYRVGIGAMMLVASDVLLFAEEGPLSETTWVSPVLWLLYFGGQVLVVLGVTKYVASEPQRG